MPRWARLVAGLFGLLLFPGGVVGVCTVRPLDALMGIACFSAMVTGGALLLAAISGEWPQDLA